MPVIDRRNRQEIAYRHYMADALHAIGHLSFRYEDTIQEKKKTEDGKRPAPEEQSETEIIDHISDMLDKMEKANECI